MQCSKNVCSNFYFGCIIVTLTSLRKLIIFASNLLSRNCIILFSKNLCLVINYIGITYLKCFINFYLMSKFDLHF